jgi:hypothetical protein
MRASRERERERACERVSELARSLAKNLKSSSSRSLARRKIEVAQLALARSRKFSPIFCTLPTTAKNATYLGFNKIEKIPSIFLRFAHFQLCTAMHT